MPTVAVDKLDLFDRLGREYTRDEFDRLCFEFGIELDDDTSNEPEVLKGAERAQYKIDIPANRYDMLCIEGIARALNVFLGRAPLPQYTILPPTTTLTIEAETAQVRPYAAAAILRGITFTQRSYNSFIALQDKLHANIARQRTLVAIGTHDLSQTKPPFVYRAAKPEQISFVPLNQTKQVSGTEFLDFYRNDRHLGRYLHIIESSPVYPTIYDSEGTLCSLPPIINSERTKITLDTHDVFIECTATDKTKLDIVLNIVTAMFAEYTSTPMTIESVLIESPHNGCSRITPAYEPQLFNTSTAFLNECLGVNETTESLSNLLKRMMLDARPSATSQGVIEVAVPATRPDVLHEVDIMEDAGVGYGFDRLPKRVPAFQTNGEPFMLNKLADILRVEAAMAGFTEVLPLILCSRDENYAWLRREWDNRAVQLANPKTLEFQIIRTSLLPGLLKTLRENRKQALPMKLFEVSDIGLHDDTAERKAINERHFAAVYAGTTSGFEVIHGLLDRVMRMLDTPFLVDRADRNHAPGYWIEEATDDPTMFPGRAAIIKYRSIAKRPAHVVGTFGVLHPEVLVKFDLPFVVSAVEFNIEPWL